MGDTLYFDLSQDRLHPAFNTLDLDLASRALGEEDGEFELSIANSVWGQEGSTGPTSHAKVQVGNRHGPR